MRTSDSQQEECQTDRRTVLVWDTNPLYYRTNSATHIRQTDSLVRTGPSVFPQPKGWLPIFSLALGGCPAPQRVRACRFADVLARPTNVRDDARCSSVGTAACEIVRGAVDLVTLHACVELLARAVPLCRRRGQRVLPAVFPGKGSTRLEESERRSQGAEGAWQARNEEPTYGLPTRGYRFEPLRGYTSSSGHTRQGCTEWRRSSTKHTPHRSR